MKTLACAFVLLMVATPTFAQWDYGRYHRHHHHMDRGYMDRGYRDRGYEDHGYEDRGYRERVIPFCNPAMMAMGEC
jgi:hypothetical protein